MPWKDFPGSSAGKESACNAGDPSSIPGWGRSPGERIGYLLQYSWTSFPGNLLDPGIKPRSPTLQTDSLPSEPPIIPKPFPPLGLWKNCFP